MLAAAPHVYNAADHLLDVIIRLLSAALVPMFIIGMAGSTIVVVITFGHDLIDFFSSEGEDALPTADNMKAS